MSAAPWLAGAIIAAGQGQRLREGGYGHPKPLVRVHGMPLIERVVRNFRAAGIDSLVVILNEAGAGCADWVRAHHPDLDLAVIVRSTASSLESLQAVLAAAPAGRVLVSTVDAWCAPDVFRGFAERAARRPADATVLALTSLVADEKPLWVRLGPEARVMAVGGNEGDAVTAGLYVFSERARQLAVPLRLGRLRDFLGWLLTSGEPVLGEMIGPVVDVDRPADVALAETLGRVAGSRP